MIFHPLYGTALWKYS